MSEIRKIGFNSPEHYINGLNGPSGQTEEVIPQVFWGGLMKDISKKFSHKDWPLRDMVESGDWYDEKGSGTVYYSQIGRDLSRRLITDEYEQTDEGSRRVCFDNHVWRMGLVGLLQSHLRNGQIDHYIVTGNQVPQAFYPFNSGSRLKVSYDPALDPAGFYSDVSELIFRMPLTEVIAIKRPYTVLSRAVDFFQGLR